MTKQNAAFVTIGSVELLSGYYLPSNSIIPQKKKPKKKEGYAYYDGETLTLWNYKYMGYGSPVGNIAVAIDLSNATTELVFRGDNVIDITGEEKSAAILINDGKLSIRGKGTLCLYSHGGELCNFGILGNGNVRITSGTLKIRTGVGDYTIGDEGERVYKADSYAVKLEKLAAPLARVRGETREEDEEGRDQGLRRLNRNDETEVIIDFPRFIIWWWRRGCLLPLLLGLLALAALLVTFWALFLRTPEILEPDFNMLELEENAKRMDDETKRAESIGGGGAVVLNFSYDVGVSLTGGKATLYFGLPGQSNKDAVLQLIIGDVLLAQSGRLPPGYQVSVLDLEDGVTERLQPGAYKGVLRVLYYDDKTGERAILDTDIEVTITVTR